MSRNAEQREWITAIRPQFTVNLSSAALLSLLVELGERGVNLTAFVQTRIDIKTNTFVVVVGFVDPNDPRNGQQVRLTQQILESRRIFYAVHNVLEVNLARFVGVPGTFVRVVQALRRTMGARPRILHAYIGENTSVYLDVGTSQENVLRIQEIVTDALTGGNPRPPNDKHRQKYKRKN